MSMMMTACPLMSVAGLRKATRAIRGNYIHQSFPNERLNIAMATEHM